MAALSGRQCCERETPVRESRNEALARQQTREVRGSDDRESECTRNTVPIIETAGMNIQKHQPLPMSEKRRGRRFQQKGNPIRYFGRRVDVGARLIARFSEASSLPRGYLRSGRLTPGARLTDVAQNSDKSGAV